MYYPSEAHATSPDAGFLKSEKILNLLKAVSTSGKHCPMKGDIKCSSSNVAYQLPCNMFHKDYIGNNDSTQNLND